MPALTPALKSASCIKKYPDPILTKEDLPYDSALVFNAGVIKHNGKYLMIFRNDYGTDEEAYGNGKGFTGTSIGFAESDNGIDNWRVFPEPLCDSHDFEGTEIKRLYDPRVIDLEGRLYLCLAMDTYHGVCGCLAELSDDLKSYKIISTSVPDNRNWVLFPEKINGYYVRLERPMPVYGRAGKDRFDLWLSKSPDLEFWGKSELVLGVEDVPYANDKIGPAAPPLKTEKGWLEIFHTVDKDLERGKNGWEKLWKKRYCAGVMLLDLEDPSKIIGMSKLPLIAPENYYECDSGFRQNVVFPCASVLEDDGEVKIYYGASDTVVCLATAKVDDLIGLCTQGRFD